MVPRDFGVPALEPVRVMVGNQTTKAGDVLTEALGFEKAIK